MKTNPKTTKTLKRKQKGYKWPSRPEVFEAFAVWLAYPKSVRDPKSQGAFAKKNEVSPDTLSDYKKKPELWEKVEEKREEIKDDIENKIFLAEAFKDLEG